MTIFLTITSPPKQTQSPSPFRQNILKQSHGGAGALQPDAACSARHSCLPAHLPSTHRQKAGQPASAWDYRKPLPNPQLSGLSRWHLPISHALFHTTESARIILGSEESRGEQSLFIESSGEQCQGKSIWSPFVYLSAFSIAADGAAHVINTTKKKSLDSI